MEPLNIEHEGYLLTTDKSKLQPVAIHKWLSEESYWAKHIPYELFKGSFDNSFTIGILKDGQQVAYARLVTDYTTFAYLADVFVINEHRGNGLSKLMMKELLALPWVQKLRRIMLATLDAKGLYAQYGFTDPRYPERLMEITRPAIYGDAKNPCK
ncbi:MAG: GNAT family N-acetyltransferase [Flavipsychrobacter sp.]